MVRRWMAMVALFATVMLAACGAPQASAKEVATQAMEAIKIGDSATARTLISPSVNSLIADNTVFVTTNVWRDSQRPVDPMCAACYGPILSETWHEPVVAGQTTTVLLTVDYQKATYEWTFTLQKESAGWKILSIKPYQTVYKHNDG
ncbi:hypothetical protein F8S13_22530 [Chloroflexia bacterium SDU3-3]|nr:hypothetical protein F8S13_22530 [Chloroflexia bacterium SDU3-3]